ncbi:MAG: hypothetical protein IT372_03145 [Polyangiaceae bacterium]|nr:hypothetical protein [Polyangiaceae bacterium]
MADGRPIPGLVQHGWNHDLGATPQDIRLPGPDPFFLWSERNLRRCQRSGLADLVVPLGAPFLYLPPIEGEIAAEPGSLLVVPIHGWEKERIQSDFSEYAAELAKLLTSFRKITVCLYFFDHQFPENRRPFEALGIEVTTVGHRDGNPAFLHDLRRLMLRFEYVCSNRAQTAIFYALALRRKAFLYGPPIGVEARLDHSGELFDAWQRKEFPALIWEGFKDRSYPEIGEDELGLRYRRDPAALRELFFWEPWQAHRLERCIAERRRRLRRARWEARLEPLRRRVGRWLPALA